MSVQPPKSQSGASTPKDPHETPVPQDAVVETPGAGNELLKKPVFWIAVIAGVVVFALLGVWLANLGGEEPQAAPDPLSGSNWEVRSYYNPANVGGMSSPVLNSQLTAKFDSGKISGSSGCNTFNGGYTMAGDELTVGPLATTMMACEQQVMDQEQAYLAALQSAASFKQEAGQLAILNAKGQVVVDFVPYKAAAAAPPTPAPSQTPVASDQSWERIQAAGKLIVGTAADYPPYEFYAGAGRFDGFDIALMNEMGKRLGVAIEYRDFAFDGLGPALEREEFDVAIAAISRTPEREALLDFSNVYLATADGVVANADSGISVGTPADLAKYRVGVQRKTVYESWIQSTLVGKGAMSPDNVFAYAKVEDGINDMKRGRIDLVLMDAQTAQTFVAKGGVKLIGKGSGQQNYAVALPKGSAALKAKLDEVIGSIQMDGTLRNLTQRYLGDAPLLPTPTPAATSTAAPTPSCSDGLVLVKSLTTEAQMKPGQDFTKGWQVMNSGTCAWDKNYRLVFVSGDKMGGEPVQITRDVPPGATYDMQVKLVAPLAAGTFEGVWQMQNGQGQGLGERLSVAITVLAPATVTPAPTQTPTAGISFTVDRTNIKAGECVTFKWKVENVQAVYFYREGERWQDHGVKGEDQRQECPPVVVTYYLRSVLRDNSVDVRQTTIYVEAAALAPQITRFTVDPAGQITLGQCVSIRWQVNGDVDTVKITANAAVLWEPAPTSGNAEDCPRQAGAATYQIDAMGPGGNSRQTQTINVVEAAQATPVPTPVPEAPVIQSFSASPNQIGVGECVALTWSIGGGATKSRILRNQAVIVDNAGFTGQQSDCLDQPGDYTYVLEAAGVAGPPVSQSQVVNVTAAAPVNPLAGTRWQVANLYDVATSSMKPVLQGSTLTMAFGAGTIDGSSGCNSYSARYLVNGAQLSIAPPMGTGTMCETPAGIMEQEMGFLTLLPSVTGYTVEGNTLYLKNAAGMAVAELTAY